MEERKTSEARRRATRKYNDAKTVGVSLRLNRGSDADIIEHLETIQNKQGYIKSLIRQDINKSGSL